jgi:BASS family bile acid:Na+ symporter
LDELLGPLIAIVTPAFAISTMLAMGLRLSLGEIVRPLRNPRFVGAALILNFAVLPLIAWALAEVLTLGADVRTGLILISAVAGAPMIPKLVSIARGDAASATALVILLIAASVVVAPLLLPMLLEGVRIDPVDITVALVWQLLLPLAVGVFVHERYPAEASAYVDEVATVSNVTLVLLFIASIGQNINGVLGLLGSGGIIAIVLLVAAAIIGGYLIALPAGVERRLMGLGSAQRNTAAAFIIAVSSFAERPTVIAFVATAGLVMMALLFPIAGEWSKQPTRLELAADSSPAAMSHPGGLVK